MDNIQYAPPLVDFGPTDVRKKGIERIKKYVNINCMFTLGGSG